MSIADRVRHAIAEGFRGTPKELAAMLGIDVRRVYGARSRDGATWPLPSPVRRTFGAWTVLRRASPSPSGVSRCHVRCNLCKRVYTREIGDIQGGRSTRCARCARSGRKAP